MLLKTLAFARSEGRGPLSKFDLRERTLSSVRRPRVPEGICPKSPTPGNLTSQIRSLLPLQITPTHVQAELLAFQFILRPWGTLLIKSRRACLSPVGSPLATAITSSSIKKPLKRCLGLPICDQYITASQTQRYTCCYSSLPIMLL